MNMAINDNLGITMYMNRRGMCCLRTHDGRFVAGVDTRLLSEGKAIVAIAGKKENNYDIGLGDDAGLKPVSCDNMPLMSILVVVIRALMVEVELPGLLVKDKPGFFIDGKSWVKGDIGAFKDPDGDDAFSIKKDGIEDYVYPHELGAVFITENISNMVADMLDVKWEELMLFLQDYVVEGMERAGKNELKQQKVNGNDDWTKI